jgi:hypothetical protein
MTKFFLSAVRKAGGSESWCEFADSSASHLPQMKFYASNRNFRMLKNPTGHLRLLVAIKKVSDTNQYSVYFSKLESLTFTRCEPQQTTLLKAGSGLDAYSAIFRSCGSPLL